MFERILVLVTGSPADRYALEYGVGLARTNSAGAHIVGVIELPTVSATIDEVREVEDEGRFVLEKHFARLASTPSQRASRSPPPCSSDRLSTR